MGKLLVRYGFEPYDTESAARRVAEKAAADLEEMKKALRGLFEQFEVYRAGWLGDGVWRDRIGLPDDMAAARAALKIIPAKDPS